jgi:hypothetical protein
MRECTGFFPKKNSSDGCSNRNDCLRVKGNIRQRILLIHKTKFLTTILFVLLSATDPVLSQNTGDYRSAANGYWTSLSSWQRYNGSDWITPTPGQGYPGEFVGSRNVSIDNGHTITIAPGGINTQQMGTVHIVNGTLYLDGVTNYISQYYFNTMVLRIESPASTVYFNNKVDLAMPVGAIVQVGPGGLTGSCNNNVTITIGGQTFAACSGAPGYIFTFAQLMANGGTINSIPSSNSPVCQGQTITLSGQFSGAYGTDPKYEWTVVAPGGAVSIYPTQNVNIANATAGTYQATLKVTTVLVGTSYSNAETMFVTVNPLSTLTSAIQQTPACQGTAAGILLSGLLPNRTMTVHYSIGGVAQPAVTGITSSSGGQAVFYTRVLGLSDNGLGMTITGITIHYAGIDCYRAFSLTLTLSVWQNGSWFGYISSDWHTASNWCGGIPDSTVDVYINASAPNQPVIGSTGATCRNISIQAGASLTITGTNELEVYGNWTRNGVFNAGSSTVRFAGKTAATVSASNFNHVVFRGQGIKTATGNLAVVGNFTVENNFSAASYSHTVSGNLICNGVLNAGSSTFILNGAAPQQIGGATLCNFYHLNVAGTGLKTLSGNIDVNGIITLTAGILEIGNFSVLAGNTSGGCATSYIRTGGTGRLTMAVNYLQSGKFVVGQSSYNPLTITNNSPGASDHFSVRVSDEAITNANDNSRTLSRRWYFNKTEAGTENITLSIAFNAGDEKGANFIPEQDPQLGVYSGSWDWATATLAGINPYLYQGTMNVSDYSGSDQFIAAGNGDAFIASQLAVTSLNPANPTLGACNTEIVVQTQNSSGVPVRVKNSDLPFSLSCSNTTFLPETPTGSIAVNTYQTTVPSITFTTSTYDFENSVYLGNATVTASAGSGSSVQDGVSAPFDVRLGTIYQPVETENWDAVNGWIKSTDGGTSWSAPFTLESDTFASTDLIRIPPGITLTANVKSSFYSMIIYGTLDIVSSGELTLRHTTLDLFDNNIFVAGTFMNSGGVFINTNPTYPISFHGGTYMHNRDGGEIPAASWESLNNLPSSCIITGITNNPLGSGLAQSFENFTWNNPGQTVVQTLQGNMNVGLELSLMSGAITTGSYKVILAEGTTVVSQNNSRINGTVRIFIPDAPDPSAFFPLGDPSAYAPLSVNFSGNVYGAGYLEAYTTTAIPPVASGLSQTDYIQRCWNLSANNISGFTSYDASFSFQPSDIAGAPLFSELALRRLSSNIWYTTNAAIAGNTMTASGLGAYGRFFIGEDVCGTTEAVWFGSVSADWNTAKNWCSGAVPDATTNVLIPAGIARYPVISAAAAFCRDITVENAAALSVSGAATLEIKGNWNNAGSFTPGSGTVSFSGFQPQTLSGNNTFYDLTVNNASGLSALSDINLTHMLTLTSANPSADKGTLDMNGFSLIMGGTSTTAGQGDVSGNVLRTGPFVANYDYSFGSSYTMMNFPSGTNITNINVNISLGTKPGWKPESIFRKYDISLNPGSGSSNGVMAFHYLDSELDSCNENNLVIWMENDTVREIGRTSNNTNVNIVAFGPFDFSAESMFSITLSPTEQPVFVWTGTIDSDWNKTGNWLRNVVPDHNSNVEIPNTVNKPVLPFTPSLTVGIKTLKIYSGGELYAVDGSILRIYGGTAVPYLAAFACDGSFFPGSNSLVCFHGNNASFSGSCSFNNISIEPGATLLNRINSSMRISGVVTNNGSWNASFAIGSSVEYNGTNQTIIQPNGGLTGYQTLIISGSGTKTLADDIRLWGNFINNGTLNPAAKSVMFTGTSAQNIGGSSSTGFYRLVVHNAMGVTGNADILVGSELSLMSDNPATNDRGSLDMLPGRTLTLGQGAVTSGAGEVSGLITRNHAFSVGVPYTFGNANQKFVFTTKQGQTLPSSVSVKVSIGTAPAWTGGGFSNPFSRTYSLAQTGGSGTDALLYLNYRDNEIPVGVDEGLISVWKRIVSQDTNIDMGWAGHDESVNWISISNIDVGLFPQIPGDYLVAIAPSANDVKVWNGIYSTDWNYCGNWTPRGTPVAEYGVIIPDANTTAYEPLLPSEALPQAICKYIILKSLSVLNAGISDSATLTLKGTGNAWSAEINSVFNAGNSTVIFDNNSLTTPATTEGSTNFYNIVVAAGSRLRLGLNSYTGILGELRIQGVLGAALNQNTVEFKGSNQFVPNPNGLTISGYNNLLISGSGIKTLSSFLEITGNFSATSGFDAGSGKVSFLGAGQQQIHSGNNSFYNLTFNNTASGNNDIVLLDDLQAKHCVSFTEGIVKSNATAVFVFSGDSAVCSAGNTISFVDGPVLKTGTVSFVFPLGDVSGTDAVWAPVGMNAPASFSSIRAQYFLGEPHDDAGNVIDAWSPWMMCNLPELNHVSGAEYWMVQTDNDHPALTLYWKDALRSGITNPTDIVAAHWNGSCWESMNNPDDLPVIEGNAGSITTTRAFTSYSPVTLGTRYNNNPLPVSLIDFRADCSPGGTHISWLTATETDNDYFTLEKSYDMQEWQSVSTVKGAGNSNELLSYEVIDEAAVEAVVYYRLRQTDYNGQYAYFGPLQSNCQHETSCTVNVFPNPFSEILFADINQPSFNEACVSIFDMDGKLIHEQKIICEKGSKTQVNIMIPRMEDGMYALRLSSGIYVKTIRIARAAY